MTDNSIQIVKSIKKMKEIIYEQKMLNRAVGLVPTMGSLHEGHLSLVRTSIKENDFNVVSIFVNPAQFGVDEDYKEYPRDIDKDAKIAEYSGVDVIFAPSVEEMYPEGYKTYINVEDLTKKLCGVSRPTHFRGVVTVVNKLFNIIQPDKAYFGQKDAQQLIIIKKMTKDLNVNVNVVSCPIIRENDGLAQSSRNIFLSREERKAATVLYKALTEAKDYVENGETDKNKVISGIKKRIEKEKLAKIDYIEVVDAENLDEVEKIEKNVLIALAVKFGKTRLIDNVIAEV